MSKIIDWMKNDKIKASVISLGSLVFIVGMIVVTINSGDTYAADTSCWQCLSDTGLNVWYAGKPDASYEGCGAGYKEVDNSYCSNPSLTYDLTATFDANGGTLKGFSSLTCTYNAASATGCTVSGLPSATRSGYAFRGWGTSSSCTSGSTSSLNLSGSSTNAYYACWEEESCWECNDGTGYVWYAGNPGAGFVYANGTSYNTSASACGPGFSSSSSSNCINKYCYFCSDMTAGNNTVYGPKEPTKICTSGWKPISSATSESACTTYGNQHASSGEGGSGGGGSTTPTTYTVTYNGNGGLYKDSSTWVDPNKGTYGSAYTTYSNDNFFVRDGYTFIGWNEKADGTGADWTPYINKPWTWTYTKDVTLYAQWKANTYTVSYNANGGSGAPSAQTKTHGVNITLSSTIPSKKGYTFVNWNTKADGTATSYKSGATFNGDANTTLYAQWKANEYKLAYKLNGGVVTGNPTSAVYDKVVTIKKPTKVISVVGNDNNTGATIGESISSEQKFTGWTSSTIDTSTAYCGSVAWKDGNTKVTDTSFKNLTPVNNATVTMIANWEPVEIILPTISKDGYTCSWNTEKDGKGTSYNSGDKYIPTANSEISINLYAICDKNNASNGSNTDEEIQENIKTGDIFIVVAWLVGIAALGYSVYYFRSRKTTI